MLNPPIHRPRNTPTALERAYARWIRNHFDTANRAEQLVYTIRVRGHTVTTTDCKRPSRDELQRHLNAYRDGGRGRLDAIPRLPVWRMARGVWHMVPRWYTDPGTRELRVAIRVDVDAHHGETDALALATRCNQLLGGRLLLQSSDHGVSAYGTITIAAAPGSYPYPSKMQINELLNELQSSLQIVGQREGYAAEVELLGRYAIVTRDRWPGPGPEPEDWWFDPRCHQTVFLCGETVKLPRITTDAELQTLTAATIPVATVHQVIQQAQQQYALASTHNTQPQSPPTIPPQAATQPQPSAYPHPHRSHPRNVRGTRRKGERIIVRDSGEPWRNKQRVASAIWASGVTDLEQFTEVCERTYVDNDLARGPRDRHREERWKGLYRWLSRRFDPTKAAGQGAELWFDAVEDIEAAVELVQGRVSRGRLDEQAARLRRRDQHLMTYGFAGAVLTIIAKDVFVGEPGEVPAAAIEGLLRHLGIPYSHSALRLAVELLREAGLVAITRAHSHDNDTLHHCTRYAVAAAVTRLPFVAGADLSEYQQLIIEHRSVRPVSTPIAPLYSEPEAGGGPQCTTSSSPTQYCGAMLPAEVVTLWEQMVEMPLRGPKTLIMGGFR